MGLEKTISSLEMKLAAARAAKAKNEEISTVYRKAVIESLNSRPKVFFVMGIITTFGSRKRRDSIRETWMPQGEDLRKLEKEKSIIIRFVIGHSATPGGVLDRAIDAEDKQHNDFFRLKYLKVLAPLVLLLQLLSWLKQELVAVHLLLPPQLNPRDEKLKSNEDMSFSLFYYDVRVCLNAYNYFGYDGNMFK